jgi:hypothetical protein
VLCLLLMGASLHAYRAGRIDLLNCSAAFSVIFVCLWMRDGSMDRLNIAMIFALICTATLSVGVWLFLAAANFVIQVPLYVLMTQRWQVNHGLAYESLDAVAVAAFVVLYFSALLLPQVLYRVRKDEPVGI